MVKHFPDRVREPAAPSGIYSTPDDILHWLSWYLDRFALKDADVRFLDHTAYLQRDNLNPVSGLDEPGRMDAVARMAASNYTRKPVERRVWGNY
jgi:hypothetical protein